MVAQMHPRSRTTMGLFGTTLAVSFLVVGLPHILPCPAPRTTFAETEVAEDGTRRRRRRRRTDDGTSTQDQVKGATADETAVAAPAATTLDETRAFTRAIAKPAATSTTTPTTDTTAMDGVQQRECPVPKPGGFVGRWLGFTDAREKRTPVEVRVEERK